MLRTRCFALRQLRFSGSRIATALGMPQRTVRAVLARHGLNRLTALSARGPENRYERLVPGELIHIDVKKLGRISARGIASTVTGAPAVAVPAGSTSMCVLMTARAWPTSRSSKANAPRPASSS